MDLRVALLLNFQDLSNFEDEDTHSIKEKKKNIISIYYCVISLKIRETLAHRAATVVTTLLKEPLLDFCLSYCTVTLYIPYNLFKYLSTKFLAMPAFRASDRSVSARLQCLVIPEVIHLPSL